MESEVAKEWETYGLTQEEWEGFNDEQKEAYRKVGTEGVGEESDTEV